MDMPRSKRLYWFIARVIRLYKLCGQQVLTYMFFILYLLTPRATSDAPLQSLFRPVKGRPSQPTRTAYRHSPVLVSTTHHRRRDTGAKFYLAYRKSM